MLWWVLARATVDENVAKDGTLGPIPSASLIEVARLWEVVVVFMKKMMW